MTCIVAVSHDNRVYMGSDSGSSTSTIVQPVGNPKIFLRHFTDGKPGVLMGSAGSFRVNDVLNYCLCITPPDKFESSDRFFRTSFVGDLQEAIGIADVPPEDGWSIILGYQGNVYHIQNDYSVLNIPNGGFAIGEGDAVALGSLHTTRHSKDPHYRITAALEAAAEICPSVIPPFVYLEHPS